MDIQEKCIAALSEEKAKINQEFAQNEDLTNDIFAKLTEFAKEDFSGVTDNKRYRYFLNLCGDIIISAFEQSAPKSYFRAVFKVLRNENISKYFSSIMQSRADEFHFVTDGLVTRCTYSWQETVPFDKEKKQNELLDFIEAHSRTKLKIKEIKQ